MGFQISKSIKLITILVAVALPLLLPTNAHAWSNNIPTCNNNISLPINISEELNYFYNYYKDSSKSYVIWYNGSTVFFTSAIDGNKLEFSGSSTQYVRLLNDYQNQYVWSAGITPPNSNGSTDKEINGSINNLGYYEENNPSSSQLYQSYQITSATCIYSVNNVIYNSSYTGNKYEGTSIDLSIDPTTQCQSWDIACYVKSIFTNVTDTFTSVGTAILKGIYYLFIPTGDGIYENILQFMDNINNQLGFLLYPIDLVNQIFDAFTDYSNGFSPVCLYSLFGSNDYCIPRLSDNQLMGGYLVYFRPIIQSAVLLFLITAYYKKLREIIQ